MKENNAAQAVEQDPINAAILLLTEEADSISDCHTRTPGDWAGEPEAKAHYDHVRSVVDALSKLRAPVADERAAFSRAEISFPLTIPENRVYLAGPMSGIAEHNFPAFHAAADRLRGSGLEVVNPADHGLVEGLGWSDYMRWDLVKLAGCHAVYVLPGWEKSKGASLEIAIARALGMPVFTVEGAALASAPVAGEAQGWSGWACQYPNKLPRLYGAKEIAQLNCDAANGDRVLFLSEHAAPQASAEPTHKPVMSVAEFCAEAGRLGLTADTLAAQLSQRPEFADCLPQADKVGGRQRAGDAERWRWATATDENAQMLYTIVQAYGGDQKKINERADFYRAALSATQEPPK